MKATIRSLIVVTALTGVIAMAPASSLAQNQKPKPTAAGTEKKEAPAGEKKQGVTPFRGKVDAVDKNAKTVRVGSRTFQITSETKIVKMGKPATLEDAVVGEEVGGSYRTGDDGKLNATMVRFGAKPEEKAAAGKAAGEGSKAKGDQEPAKQPKE